jgi:hypothetical protein
MMPNISKKAITAPGIVIQTMNFYKKVDVFIFALTYYLL